MRTGPSRSLIARVLDGHERGIKALSDVSTLEYVWSGEIEVLGAARTKVRVS